MIPKLKSRHDLDMPYRWTRTPGVVGSIFTLTGAVLVLTTLVAFGVLATQYAVVLGIGLGTLIVGFIGLTIAASRHEERTGFRSPTSPSAGSRTARR